MAEKVIKKKQKRYMILPIFPTKACEVITCIVPPEIAKAKQDLHV